MTDALAVVTSVPLLDDLPTLLMIAAAALVGSTASALTGSGGGVTLSLVLTPILGVAAVVPVLTVAMLVSHVARVGAFWSDIDRPAAARVLAGAMPGCVLGALIFTMLPEDAIALVLGVFLAALIGLRYLIPRLTLTLPLPALILAAFGYGLVAGTTIGGGILVLPVLMGAGLSGAPLVATDALIGLVVNLLRTLAFGGAALLTPELLMAGLVIGACTIPAAYFARVVLAWMPIRAHTLLIDGVIGLAALSFLRHALA